jgi:serine beta-lactamase-like protein LACTB
MLRRILSLTIVLAILVPGFWIQAQESTVSAAPSLAAQADARLSRYFKADQPGVAILLMQDGKVLFKKGYGLANVNQKVPIQSEMVFHIGSITKQFTAAAVMLLVEEGKVNLQAPISSHLENLPKAWKEITVEQLLNHTSGIPDYTDTKGYFKRYKEDITPNQILDYVNTMPLIFEPGTKYRYTNTGYVLLGMLIEKLSGESYAVFLKKYLFKPLDLKYTDYAAESMLEAVLGYNSSGKPAIYESMTQPFSAGALVSNAEDLARWTLALHNGKVVKPESLARMLTPTRIKNGEEIPYGFGLAFRKSQGNLLVGHGGYISGFSCYLEADPATKTVVVILHNTSEPKVDIKYFSEFLLLLAEGKPLF